MYNKEWIEQNDQQQQQQKNQEKTYFLMILKANLFTLIYYQNSINVFGFLLPLDGR